MKRNVQSIINDLTNNGTEKLLFYYQQGFEIGKEEMLIELTEKMISANIESKTISKITSMPLETINQIIQNP